MSDDRLQEYYNEQDRKSQLEHRDILLAINVILKQKEGLDLFTYLFKHFDVACVPERGMTGEDLQEYLGFLRAGNSIFKLVSEADSEIAAKILALTERKKYEDRLEQYRQEQYTN